MSIVLIMEVIDPAFSLIKLRKLSIVHESAKPGVQKREAIESLKSDTKAFLVAPKEESRGSHYWTRKRGRDEPKPQSSNNYNNYIPGHFYIPYSPQRSPHYGFGYFGRKKRETLRQQLEFDRLFPRDRHRMEVEAMKLADVEQIRRQNHYQDFH